MISTRRAVLLAMAALPSACASSNPTLYTLAAVPGPIQGMLARNIEIRAIGLPHYLERSQIVRSSEGYRMDVLPNDWWGEPLDAMIGRILVEELEQRLPGSTVYTDRGAITASPAATVEINLQRFDLDAAGNVLLRAAVAVAVQARGSVTRGVVLNVRPASSTTAALVAAMSAANARLADTIAAMLVSG